MTNTEIRHPAKYSAPIMDILSWLVLEELKQVSDNEALYILDPFAGTGKIHKLGDLSPRVSTWGIEIEFEWASMTATTFCMDMREMSWANYFHMVITSPTYGNRMADHHNAKDGSKRMTYKHILGRDLSPGNSGQLHFGDDYKKFHIEAWEAVSRAIRQPHGRTPGGLFVLNVSDFIRRGERIAVCDWHCDTILSMGYDLVLERDVPTPRLRYGQNHAARVTHEKIFVFRRTQNR